MRPPENILRMHIGFSVTCVAAPAGSFPESSHQLFSTDISPAMLDISFIGNLIQNHRLSILYPVLVYQFCTFVHIGTLNATVCNPRSCVVIHRYAMMDGTQMMIRIFFADCLCHTFPILNGLLRQKIIFISQRPPYISISRKTGQYIFPVKLIILRFHLAESPSVIRMHHNQIRFYPHITQFLYTGINMLKMPYMKSGEIPLIPFALSHILHKIIFGQQRAVNRHSFIGIRNRFVQIIIIMFGKNTEAYLIKGTVFQCLQCLLLQFFILQFPHITSGPQRIVRCSVLISKMISIADPDRPVIFPCGFSYLKGSLICLSTETSEYTIRVGPRKRRHKPNFVNTISIIESIHRQRLLRMRKRTFDIIICKWIALRMAFTGNLLHIPLFQYTISNLYHNISS